MKKIPTLNNKELFEQAFIHRSYLNETKQKTQSNERLEFLGDSILSFVVSEHLYHSFPESNEGILTNLRSLLVNTKSLAIIAKELEFGKYLKLSKGEEESKGRENESLLANSLEAYIGALYLDQGIPAVRSFLLSVLLPKADDFMQQKALKDPKSLLQERVQAQKLTSPAYKVLVEEGPAHLRQFTVGVFIEEVPLGTGKGRSKQQAEEQAAEEALMKLDLKQVELPLKK